MEYREIEANNIDEAKLKIRREYGDTARIIKVKEIPKGGFLGFGKKKKIKVLISVTDVDLLKKYRENMGIREIKPKKEIIIDDLEESLRRENQSKSLNIVLEKLNKIEKELGNNSYNREDRLHANLLEIKQILKDNEFYDDFINKIISSVEQDLPYTKLNDKLEVHKYTYDYIKEKLVISNNIKRNKEKNVFILVGPTGVGKTTTIAKIAANAIKEKIKVELITIDGYRIGAKYQLEKYAEYMRTPMTGVEDNLELQKIVDLSEANLILIDTIGRSANDEMNLVKMKQLLKLKNCNTEYILTVSASVKQSEVKKIFKSFDLFEYGSIIITKLDESETIGAIINCSIDRKCGIKYFTTGQRVPNDIEKAESINLMTKIKGLDTEVYLSNVRY